MPKTLLLAEIYHTDYGLYGFSFRLSQAYFLLSSVHVATFTFYRAALNATRCNAALAIVKPSVRLSVTRVYCEKTNGSSADILIPYERKIIYFFGHKE